MLDLARSFDFVAEEYERTRPDYPPALLERLPIPRDATVLDLGAGTGKLTRVLVGRFAAVIAVEPLDRMRAILERAVPAAQPIAGRAEDIPIPDGSVDAVFAAQAFQWFANDAAVAEIARVLRPGGCLCLVWNGPDHDRSSPLPERFTAYLEELRGERSTEDSEPFGDVVRRGPFGEITEFGISHDHVLDRRGLLENARSLSWIASRSPADRKVVLRRLGALLPEGTYAIPNVANVLWARRT